MPSAPSSREIMKKTVDNQEEEDSSQQIKSVKLQYAAPKSILKKSVSPDIKEKSGPALAWQDFHGKDLYTVREFTASDDESEDADQVWEGEKRPCCSIM